VVLVAPVGDEATAVDQCVVGEVVEELAVVTDEKYPPMLAHVARVICAETCSLSKNLAGRDNENPLHHRRLVLSVLICRTAFSFSLAVIQYKMFNASRGKYRQFHVLPIVYKASML